MMLTRLKFTIVMLVFVLQGFNGWGQGNLLIAPVRVVFDNQKLKEDLNLTNVGNDTAVYLVSFVNYKMLPNGSFQILEKGDSLTSADKYLRVFPRRVKLGPNESQALRLQCRKPEGMNAGEYRSHLFFRAEKGETPLGMGKQKVDSTKMSISITAIFGISIPVIIRNGNLSVENSLSDVKLKALTDSTSMLSFKINRTGNRSSYGNITVDLLNDNGQRHEVGIANGVGVYPEITSRDMNLVVRWPKAIKSKGGKLIIKYSLPRDDGGGELAGTEFNIP